MTAAALALMVISTVQWVEPGRLEVVIEITGTAVPKGTEYLTVLGGPKPPPGGWPGGSVYLLSLHEGGRVHTLGRWMPADGKREVLTITFDTPTDCRLPAPCRLVLARGSLACNPAGCYVTAPVPLPSDLIFADGFESGGATAWGP